MAFLTTLLKNPLGLIAAAAPFIVKSIDDNRARLEAAAKLHDSEIRAATELAMEITCAVDRVVNLNREAVFGIMFRRLSVRTIPKLDPSEPDRKAWETYQRELEQWNSSRTSGLVRVSATFNRETKRLYSGLCTQIEFLQNMANAGFFERRTSHFFIKDTLRSQNCCPGKVDFLIKLLQIDPDELPGLVNTIEQFCTSSRNTTAAMRTDFRCKYNPIFDNCRKELTQIGELMLAQIQSEHVGALRYR